MWLEYEILKNPDVPGYFSVSTSYRSEPNPVPGRHDLIFPMFEFECKGDMDDLVCIQKDLLTHLGYTCEFYENDYTTIAEEFGVTELEHEHEERLYTEKSPVAFIKHGITLSILLMVLKSKKWVGGAYSTYHLAERFVVPPMPSQTELHYQLSS